MAASYPSSVKSFSTKVDFSTTVIAEHVNSLQEEVVAVQDALGTSPATSSGWSGTFDGTAASFATVKARLNNLEFGVKNVHDKIGGSNILPVANGGTGISSLGTGIATFLGTPSSANLASAVTDETGSGLLVFATSPTLTTPTINDPRINLALNAQTGTTYTFVLTDNGRLVTADNGSSQTYSIPTNSTAFPIGSQINVVQLGVGQVTIQALTPGTTTINSTAASAAAPKLRARYSAATCIKIATEVWVVFGDLA